jgi:hypothetical protein
LAFFDFRATVMSGNLHRGAMTAAPSKPGGCGRHARRIMAGIGNQRYRRLIRPHHPAACHVQLSISAID